MSDICPNCGIGRDMDGDGDCPACAKAVKKIYDRLGFKIVRTISGTALVRKEYDKPGYGPSGPGLDTAVALWRELVRMEMGK